MSENVFSNIRQACEAVAESARWVKIKESNLFSYPETIELAARGLMTHDPSYHTLSGEAETVAFFVILDSVNFGSGYFPFIDKSRGPSGYFSIAGRLKDLFESRGVPKPSELAAVDESWCGEVFGQSDDNAHARELMWRFAQALNELGVFLDSRCEGRFERLFSLADTAAGLVSVLAEMPAYRDEHAYGALRVPFYKRAQILLQDIAIALPHHPVAHLADLNELTIFADNIVPYVLRIDGILELHPWLEARIEAGEIIGSGSAEEIELRACALHAVEQVAQLIAEDGRHIPPRQLDFHLWSRGQQLKPLSSLKRHRTRCVFY